MMLPLTNEFGSDTPGRASQWVQGEEEDALQDGGAGSEAVLGVAVTVVGGRRGRFREPLTLSMPSRRCLAQRRAFLSAV